MSINSALWNHIAASEEGAVRALGEAIGYGRMMQLAEQIWNAKRPGAAHSVGCCTFFLVPCPSSAHTSKGYQSCDWCCGSGRTTKRVADAIREAGALQFYADPENWVARSVNADSPDVKAGLLPRIFQSAIEADWGRIAREALAARPAAGPGEQV